MQFYFRTKMKHIYIYNYTNLVITFFSTVFLQRFYRCLISITSHTNHVWNFLLHFRIASQIPPSWSMYCTCIRGILGTKLVIFKHCITLMMVKLTFLIASSITDKLLIIFIQIIATCYHIKLHYKYNRSSNNKYLNPS